MKCTSVIKNLTVLGVAFLLLVTVLLGGACLPDLGTPTATLTPDGTAGLEAVDQAWKLLFQDYVDKARLDPQKLSQGAIKGMLEALDDPYTAYLDRHGYEMELQGLEGKFQGIGAYVGVREGQVVVISAIPGSPAEKAGIRAGDRVIEVDGQTISGLSLAEVVLRIRGPAGTTVTLLIQRQDVTESITVSITRAEIELKTVSWEMKGDIAYVRVNHFAQPTADEFGSAVEGILDGRATGMVLDLRSNPGGLLASVVDIASHFLDGGAVVYVVDRDGKRSELVASPHKRKLELPVVVLVDEFSASGSEVLAGALRDRGVAKLVGVKT
ncbi:MAG: S41 family peptidase, partial [Chloroflexota bacterium]